MDLSHEERIAALLDGRYSAEERERLLAELAGNDDDMEMLAAVSAALREYEEEEAGEDLRPAAANRPVLAVDSAPPRRPPRWRRFAAPAVGLALAAGIAALVALPALRRPDGPAEMVSLLAHPAAPLPPGAEVPRDPPRGGGGTGLSDGERIRLGASLVELEVKARTDPAGVPEAARQVALLLKPSPVQSVRMAYDSISRNGLGPAGLDPALARRAESTSGPVETVRLGEWLQTARIAAVRGDHSFFRRRESRRRLDGRGVPPELRTAADDGLQRARTALGASTPDWKGLKGALDDLLRVLSH